MTTTTKPDNRAYAASHFVLELDQKEKVAFLRSVSGGGVRAETLTHKMGNINSLWKQLGKPAYEDISVECGMSMAESFVKWIESFVKGEVVRKNGAILAGDFHYKERAKREFGEALISEVTIPKLDASDKNPCYMTIKIVPETVRFSAGSNQSLDSFIGDPKKQKLWTPARFSLTIDDKDLKESCKRCTKIDTITIKQQILEYPAGNKRDKVRVPGRLEYPNVTFYLPESDAQPFMTKFTKRVIDGVPPPATRLTGTITLRDNAGGDLCEIKMEGVDIGNCAPEKSDASGDALKLVKVELTVEKMELKYIRDTSSPGATAGARPTSTAGGTSSSSSTAGPIAAVKPNINLSVSASAAAKLGPLSAFASGSASVGPGGASASGSAGAGAGGTGVGAGGGVGVGSGGSGGGSGGGGGGGGSTPK